MIKLSSRFSIFAALLAAGAYFVFFYSASESDQADQQSDPVASTQDTILAYSQEEEDAAWEALINPVIKPMHHPNAVIKTISADKNNPDEFKIKVTNMELLTHPVLEEEVVFHTGPDKSFTAQVDSIEITPYGNKVWTAIHTRDGVPFFSQVTVGDYIVLSHVTDGKNTYHYNIDKSTGEGTLRKHDRSKIRLHKDMDILEDPSPNTTNKSASTIKKNKSVHHTLGHTTHTHEQPKRG